MSEKSFTVATTNFGSSDVKHLRYFYLTFSLKDTVNNVSLLSADTVITLTIKSDRDIEETYSFIPTSLGYQRKKIPLNHTQKGVWWTATLTTEYDFTCESGECLIIPIAWRD